MQDFFISRFNSFSLSTKGLTPENLLERSRKEFVHVPHSKTLVVCLPGGGQNLWSFWRVKAHATHNGASFLAYSFPRQVLSNDAELTRKCFEVIDRTVREDIRKFKAEYGFEKCVVTGLSLAGSFASMVYKNNPDINEIIMVTPGENLARDMWHGIRTRHLRRSYEKQGITREELERLWHDLSPENNLPAPGTKLSLHLGRQDKVAPYVLAKTLPETLKRHGFAPRVHVYYLCGHYAVSCLFLLFPNFMINLKKPQIA